MKLQIGVFTVMSGLAFLSSTARAAENFPRTDAHQVRSLTSGMGASTIPILERVPSGSGSATMSTLLSAMCGTCDGVTTEARADRSRAVGGSWHIDVFGTDGSAAEYSDDAAWTRQEVVAQSHPAAISAANLESAGRNFIASKLSGAIKLQPGEAIVPELVSYLKVTGGSADGKVVVAPKVIANAISFTREINGIPVVGPGSKISIIFLNDGTVASFRYDWAAYASTGRSQNALPVGDVLQRVQRVVGARSNGVALQPVIVPANVTPDTQVDLGADMRLARLACGYYDQGFIVRGSAPLQAGCYYHASHVVAPAGQVSTAAFAGAVPASTNPELDDAWSEEAFLRGRPMSSMPPPPSAAVPTPNSRPAPSRNP